jgi:hypothetical protein
MGHPVGTLLAANWGSEQGAPNRLIYWYLVFYIDIQGNGMGCILINRP